MASKQSYKYSLFVILAGLSWGMIGLFVKGLGSLGLTPMEIVTVRVMFSCLFLVLFGVLTSKQKHMTISIKHIHLFLGTGLMSIAFFNWAYFTSMEMLSISVAVILLYTAPAFVMILSVLFLGEKLTGGKVLLLCLTLIGCFLVTGITGLADFKGGQLIGYAIGLASGFGYALYSIFGKFAIRHYSSFTVSFYTFFIASVFLIPFTKIWEVTPLLLNWNALFLIMGLCLISTVLAFLLYTEGLNGIESSKASILATVEPLAAMIIGFIVFGERVSYMQLAGGAIIFISATLASVNLAGLLRKRRRLT
ncbi:MAG: DMT family transporter [Bacillus sp. (in: firmicutes)]